MSIINHPTTNIYCSDGGENLDGVGGGVRHTGLSIPRAPLRFTRLDWFNLFFTAPVGQHSMMKLYIGGCRNLRGELNNVAGFEAV